MRIAVLVLVLLLGSCAPQEAIKLAGPEPLLVQNVNVVDTKNGRIQPGLSVLVMDERISAVGPDAERLAPPDALLVDGTGKFLIPGLWDMHVHTSSDQVTRDTILPIFIANGVTGIRSMAADCIQGQGGCSEPVETIYDVTAWRKDIAAGDLVGPRIVASSYYTNSPEDPADSTIYNPATAAHGRAYARLLKERGVDLIKVYSKIYPEAYFAMADEANRLGLPFAGHVPVTVRASEASDAGHQSIEHITGFLEECSTEEASLRPQLVAGYWTPAIYWPTLIGLAETFSEEKCAELYSVLVRNGTWHVPTLKVDDYYDQLESPRQPWRHDERLKYVAREEVELWDSLEKVYYTGIDDYKTTLQPKFHKSFQITGATYAAGVPILAGSDAGEYGIFWGFGLHEELELLVEAGLTNADALRAATLWPAIFLGAVESSGTVEPGKRADLVLLNANPLDDISNTQSIDAVIANGRFFNRSALDTLLDNVEAAASQ